MPSAIPPGIHSNLVASKSVPLCNCPPDFNSNTTVTMQPNIVVIALVVSMACAATLMHEKRHAFQKHNRMLKSFACELPQPRVFELEQLPNNEELIKYISKGLKNKIQPPVTVLHRCQGAGCCEDPNQRCMPIEDEEVTLTFSFANGRLHYIDVKAMNHTRCACNSNYDDDIK